VEDGDGRANGPDYFFLHLVCVQFVGKIWAAAGKANTRWRQGIVEENEEEEAKLRLASVKISCIRWLPWHRWMGEQKNRQNS
jgi:hypothetical protein